MSALSNPNSLCVSLMSPLISDSSLCVSALIDSSSTHCFVDTSFVQYYKLPAYPVDPIELKLFDGTSNSIITQSVALPVKFLSGECMNVNFYVTLLNPSCSVVLGDNWLTCYNLLIDWILGSIIFHPQLLDPSFPKSTSSARAAKLPPQNSSISDETPKLPASAPSIVLISTAPFKRLCKLQGTQTFHIHLSDIYVSANSASISEEVLDLSNVLEEYHDFANIFSKAKAEKLALHWPYDLKINLEEGTSPPIIPMYPLSQSELEVLHNFLDDHLQTRFIHQTSSSHGAQVIFALKKDKTLHLCIDF